MVAVLIFAAALGAAPTAHVPAPPVLPGAGLFGTGLEERKRLREAYRIALDAFVAGLSPEQAKALVLDETETLDLALARAFLRGVDPATGKAVIARSRSSEALLVEGSEDGARVAAGDGRKVYNASQCIGSVINGACHGSIMPDGGYHPTCHGEMLGGSCTGPMF